MSERRMPKDPEEFYVRKIERVETPSVDRPNVGAEESKNSDSSELNKDNGVNYYLRYTVSREPKSDDLEANNDK